MGPKKIPSSSLSFRQSKEPFEAPALVFRFHENGGGPELLREVFEERGWVEYQNKEQEDDNWNLWWRSSYFNIRDYENICPWQHLNHFPKTSAITKKDALVRNLRRMKCLHGSNIFNFSPLSFNLPNDYHKFLKEHEAMRDTSKKKILWICKPADLSCGRGIFIFQDVSGLLYDCGSVVQQYIENPLLIGGYKFDLRIYIVVTAFHPLEVYAYEEGIVRFSTEKFDLNKTDNIFAHLTNFSINKYSPAYTVNKQLVGAGCKWTLKQLRHYFFINNINDRMLWRQIINIVVLTLMTQAPLVPKVKNCFELFGFDVLVDETMKPWLLEVNCSPSLLSDCVTDIQVKKQMLHDLIDLIGLAGKDQEPVKMESHRKYFHQGSQGHSVYTGQGKRTSMIAQDSRQGGKEKPEAERGFSSREQKDHQIRRGSSWEGVQGAKKSERTEGFGGRSELLERCSEPSCSALKPRAVPVHLSFKKNRDCLSHHSQDSIYSSEAVSDCHQQGKDLRQHLKSPNAKRQRKTKSLNLRKQVGSFHLIFPFSEKTEKTAQTSLDPRVVIKELQRMLSEFDELGDQQSNDFSSLKKDSFMENQGLWGPLIMKKIVL